MLEVTFLTVDPSAHITSILIQLRKRALFQVLRLLNDTNITIKDGTTVFDYKKHSQALLNSVFNSTTSEICNFLQKY
jgi:predicted DNA binding protein